MMVSLAWTGGRPDGGAAVRPRGLVRKGEVPLGQEPGVERETDQFSGIGYRAGCRLAGGAHSLDDFEDESVSAAVRVRSAIWTRWRGCAGQTSTRPGSRRTGSPVRTVKRGRRTVRPAAVMMVRMARRIPLPRRTPPRLCAARLGRTGPPGRVRLRRRPCALEPVEAGCGGGGMVAAGLGQAAVGEIVAESREGVPVGGPPASCRGSLGEGAQQRDRVPGRIPCRFQLSPEGGC